MFGLKNIYFVEVARGFRSTKITESPRRNIFEMNRSLLTGFTFFLPFPVRGTSVHISLTLSSTMLQWRSNAFTRPKSFLLLRQLIRTWVLFLTDCVRTESGPVLNSSSSWRANSSGVSSDLGFTIDLRSWLFEVMFWFRLRTKLEGTLGQLSIGDVYLHFGCLKSLVFFWK